QGLIKSRSGSTMIIQAADSTQVVVLLTDKTQVGQIEGILQVRRKEMSMAALIPGLDVQVEGMYNGLNQLEATLVKFKGNDLARAKSIQAGLHDTHVQAQRNKEELEKHATELQKQNAELKSHSDTLKEQNENLQQQQAQLTAQQQKIAANRAAI